MTENAAALPELLHLPVGAGNEARQIAYRRQPPQSPAPGLFWLGGFKSDMDGGKALALQEFAKSRHTGFTRFDYSGHGLSGGDFLDGTISRWLEEAESILLATSRPGEKRILIGSSMGGWLALLLNKALRGKPDAPAITGLVLIAPALDMTADLMWSLMSTEERDELKRAGRVKKPNDYAPEPYIITRQLIEDGRKHLFGSSVIGTGCPVYILQGVNDSDVPVAHALKLASQLPLDDVVLRLVPGGDHRLSRPQDLALLRQAVERLLEKE